ncbi:hypothetical protein ACQKCJ_02945 [Flavobacterium sp. NPDC079362]|uniref:hypothetical protein n=1 Tax=Flavobacterium sp. NPDC079362 TaxID=3390566 RepID=UPI003D08326F
MEIIIAIIGLWIAWITYHRTFDTTEDKNNFLVYFKVTQQLHLEVQSLLQKYIDSNNGANHKLYNNMTYKQCLNMLKDDFQTDYSDKVYVLAKNDKVMTKKMFATLIEKVEAKNQTLQKLKTQLLYLN